MSGNAAAVLTQPGFRKIEWLKRDIDVERRPDGVVILKSRIPLQAYEKHIPAFLRRWGQDVPDRVFMAQRRGPERAWTKVTYGEALATVDRLTQTLLDLGLSEQRPVMEIGRAHV